MNACKVCTSLKQQQHKNNIDVYSAKNKSTNNK